MQEPDLHMIRRSACHNIHQKRGDIGAEHKQVLFGAVDEGILRQTGLMDSTETLDILELEPNSTAIHKVCNYICENTLHYTIHICENSRKGKFGIYFIL